MKLVTPPTYAVQHRQPDATGGAGWYWGTAHVEPGVGVVLSDAKGPFDTAGDAGLDMVRTWLADSVVGGHG